MRFRNDFERKLWADLMLSSPMTSADSADRVVEMYRVRNGEPTEVTAEMIFEFLGTTCASRSLDDRGDCWQTAVALAKWLGERNAP